MSETHLVERLEKLERGNWQLKAFAVAALVLGAAALASVYVPAPARPKITAREFDVVDNYSGKTHVRMGSDADGSWGIGLLDAQANPRVGIVVDPHGDPDIELIDAQGKGRASISLAGIALADAQGHARMFIVVDSHSDPQIELTDPQGFSMDLGSASTGQTRATSAA